MALSHVGSMPNSHAEPKELEPHQLWWYHEPRMRPSFCRQTVSYSYSLGKNLIPNLMWHAISIINVMACSLVVSMPASHTQGEEIESHWLHMYSECWQGALCHLYQS